MHELHSHQKAVKSEIYQAIRSEKKHIMVKAATAFGKTVLAASIIHDAMSKGIGVVFAVPTLTLIDQTLKEFSMFGLDCGVIQADHFATDYSKPVQIASIQTIASKLKRGNKAELFHMSQYYRDKIVIVDEAHMMFKAQKWLNDATTMPVIGLSATPWAKGLGLWYDHIVNGPSVEWLIENEYLSKYRAYSHHQPDMKGVSVNASGDYSLKEAGDKYTPAIIGDIVATWEKHAIDRKTILFAPRVVDAERFAAEFNSAGHKAVAVSGYMDNEDCAAEIERFRAGEITIICSVAKLTTGFDVRDIGCIIDVQPTKSLMRHVQKLGRGLRVHPDKDDVIILDNAGNLLRNGLPDGEYPTELDDGKHGSSGDRKDQDDPLPVACSACSTLKPPKTRICPTCGFAPERQSNIEVEAGDLVELKTASAKRNRKYTHEQKQAIYGGLKMYARDRGFKIGWASNKYRDYMGVWPNAHRDAPFIQPSEEVLGYIKHCNIAYAKRNKK